MGFVFIISSLIILYSDGYMFDDLNIFRFVVREFLSVFHALMWPYWQ